MMISGEILLRYSRIVCTKCMLMPLHSTTRYKILPFKIYFECHTSRIFTQPLLSIMSKYASQKLHSHQALL